MLGLVRYRIDTVFGQLINRGLLKRVRARNLWHLHNRLLRVILMHTWCVWLNQQQETPCLQLNQFVASQLAHRAS